MSTVIYGRKSLDSPPAALVTVREVGGVAVAEWHDEGFRKDLGDAPIWVLDDSGEPQPLGPARPDVILRFAGRAFARSTLYSVKTAGP